MDKLSLNEAVECLCSNCEPVVETERISLWNASGRVLSENLISEMDQPPFPRSPLDGYALKSEDTTGALENQSVKLKVIDEIMAGSVGRHHVKNGEAVRIMTGAPIPPGADCIIRQEDTDYGENEVKIYKELKQYDNYCFKGEDFKNQQLLLKKGVILSAPEIGIIASCGKPDVLVYKKPAVALITTGDETMVPGTALKPGKIYDSNMFTLGCRLKELGVVPECIMHVDDQTARMVCVIQEISGYTDLIITTGGVSVGKKDIMHEVFKQAGVKTLFWKVSVKPGTPTLCGKYNNTLIICLSGNPFAALTNMELLVKPVLSKMLQKRDLEPDRITVPIDKGFEKGSRVTRYVRGYLNDGKVTIPTNKHSSGILSSMAGCNCLIEIPAGNYGVHKGDQVCVIPM
nr:gephyrin-like molybdotransferase Glp [uncultured Clostridium sp.]